MTFISYFISTIHLLDKYYDDRLKAVPQLHGYIPKNVLQQTGKEATLVYLQPLGLEGGLSIR